MTGFHVHILDPHFDAAVDADKAITAFDALSSGVDFEDVTKGRVGNHLVDVSEAGVPIVRTTTRYEKPAHCFSAAHHEVVRCIQQAARRNPTLQKVPAFNNALIEIYGREYHKMGYHSDQALDLAEGSFIALYSCYERPDDRSALRTLKVKEKTGDEETSILLEHNSVVLFSLETNTRHLHKIVLEPKPSPNTEAPDNRWLGLTFRESGTYLRFEDGAARLANGDLLQLADEDQRKSFYRMRGQENRDMAFVYPEVGFTISAADLLEPVS